MSEKHQVHFTVIPAEDLTIETHQQNGKEQKDDREGNEQR